jgi:hypothetical protein
MLVIVYTGKTRRVEIRPQRPVIGATYYRTQRNVPDADGSRLQTALLHAPRTTQQGAWK